MLREFQNGCDGTPAFGSASLLALWKFGTFSFIGNIAMVANSRSENLFSKR